MREQDTDDSAVELDDPVLAAGRLRAAEHGAEVLLPAVGARRLLAGQVDDLLADDQHAALEVDVVPAQPDGLAAAQAGGGDELEQRPEPVAGHMVEELAELCRLPGAHTVARRGRELDVDGRVEGDEPLPLRGGQRAP